MEFCGIAVLHWDGSYYHWWVEKWPNIVPLKIYISLFALAMRLNYLVAFWPRKYSQLLYCKFTRSALVCGVPLKCRRNLRRALTILVLVLTLCYNASVHLRTAFRFVGSKTVRPISPQQWLILVGCLLFDFSLLENEIFPLSWRKEKINVLIVIYCCQSLVIIDQSSWDRNFSLPFGWYKLLNFQTLYNIKPLSSCSKIVI